MLLAAGCGDTPAATDDTSTSAPTSTSSGTSSDSLEPPTPTSSGTTDAATPTTSESTSTSAGTGDGSTSATTGGSSESTTTAVDVSTSTGDHTSGTDTTSETTDTGIMPCMTWDRTHGGRKADHGNALVQVPGDGFAIAGRTASKGAGGDDMWLVRIDEAGEALWEQTYGTSGSESANAIALAPDGGFLLAGTSYTAQTSLDWSIVRTTSTGEVMWTRTFTTSDADHAFAAVAVAEGGFAVAGTRDRVAKGTGRFWLIRLDDDGATMWEQIFGDLDKEQLAYDLVEFPGAGFAIAGTAHDDFWLVRTDMAGKKLWDRSYDHDPMAHDRAMALVRMPDDGLTLAGWSQGASTTDAWVVRTDAAGEPLWNLPLDHEDHDFIEGMAVLPDDGLVLVGHGYSNGQVADLRIYRTEADGMLVWTTQHGGADYDFGLDITVLPNQDLTIVGRTASTGAGDLDLWALRTSPTGHLVCD